MDFSSPDPLVLTVTLTTSYKTRLWSNLLLSHLEAADAGVEGIVSAGHVSQLAHADNLQLGVTSAGPQDVSHSLLAQLLYSLDVLETN